MCISCSSGRDFVVIPGEGHLQNQFLDYYDNLWNKRIPAKKPNMKNKYRFKYGIVKEAVSRLMRLPLK